MTTTSRMRPWRWALLLLAALISVLALMPAPPRQMDLGWDKLNHVFAFAALGLCAVFGWRGSRAALLAVLLALLALGVRKIRLGPTLPAFLSQNVVDVLVKAYELQPIADAQEDVQAILAGH
jgi:VanZ family protein